MRSIFLNAFRRPARERKRTGDTLKEVALWTGGQLIMQNENRQRKL